MERQKPVTGETYHVYNRGVDKRTIFENTQDYVRFVHDLWEFNDRKPAQYIERRVLPHDLSSASMYEVSLPTSRKQRSREKLVEILAWCLMPNHFHLMLRQLVDNGIPDFMRKIGTGYTNAFNLLRDRSGSLFQGVYKYKHVTRDAHFFYLPHYIHLNPVDLGPKGDHEVSRAFLDSYRWSSFKDYCGMANFPSLTEESFVVETYGDKKLYQKEIGEWFLERDDGMLTDVLID